ncbi:MAG: hypothetical protein KGS72_08830 [Cyanobacteria bacterium REEB67]|nr:hypothetical protein [Cyanobacteria bacterium REEB67]
MDDYTDRESDRLSRIMVNDPHAAADEMRDQLQQLDPRAAADLVRKTKDDEFVGGLGDLQIQVELTQNGCDSGFRNVTMATPDGVEQIAEMQTNQAYCAPDGQVGYDNGYRVDPLAAVAGIIVGDLLWGQRRGYDFDDDRYRGWQERERYRENDWNDHRDDFRRNWQDQGYRDQFQNQDWHQNSWNQTNTYITTNRVSNTTINETNINNQRVNNGGSGARPYYQGGDQRPHGPAPIGAPQPIYDPRMQNLGRIAPVAPAAPSVPAYDGRQRLPHAGQGQFNRPAENQNLGRPNPQQIQQDQQRQHEMQVRQQQQQQQLDQQRQHEMQVRQQQQQQQLDQQRQHEMQVRQQELQQQRTPQPQHREAPPPPPRPAAAPQPDPRQPWEQQHKRP